MKYFILFFIPTLASAACVNNIATSEITSALAKVPNAGAKQCDKNDPCVCFDGIDWDVAVWDGKALANDPTKAATKLAAAISAKQAADSQVAQDATDVADVKAKLQAGSSNAADVAKLLKILIRKTGM